jgi:hypothetical protein
VVQDDGEDQGQRACRRLRQVEQDAASTRRLKVEAASSRFISQMRTM